MESFHIKSLDAQKRIHTADHMLTQTYPLIKDPKLLLGVVENINLSVKQSLAALIEYERYFKNIPPCQDDFQSHLNMYQLRLVKKYDFPKSYLTLFHNLQSTHDAHQKSAMEFSRKDRYVMATDDYKLRTLSTDELKKWVQTGKLFSEDVRKIVGKNGRQDI